MVQPAKYSIEWYKKQEEEDLKLRSKLLKHTKKRNGETAREWLNRVNALYRKQTKVNKR